MKKLLISLLAASMTVSAFAGCGNSPSSGRDESAPAVQQNKDASGTNNVNQDGTVNDPTKVSLDENKLVFWSLFSGGDGDYMDQIIADYNATNPAKQVQSVMLVWADYYTKLATSVAANKGPDIGISHASKLPELVQQGIVQSFDIEANTAGLDWNDYNQRAVDSITFDGEKYAVPLDTHAEIMFFNKDILDDAGITLDADGKVPVNNAEEFRSLLDQAKDALPDGGTTISLSATGDDPYRVWWASYFQMGGTPIVEGDSITLDKEIGIRAAEYVKSLYDEGYIAAGIEDHGKVFQGGQAAFYWGGTWSVGGYEQTNGFNFGAQAFPKLFNNDSGWADAHVMTLPFNKSRSPDDTQSAVDFLAYAGSEGAVTWAGSGQIPSSLTAQQSQTYLDMAYRSSYKEAAAAAVLPPQHENFYSMKDAMIKSLDTIWAGQAEPESAIEDMYRQIESNLK